MLTTTVCAALSAAGLAIAFLTAYRRRFASATRIAAFALVPVGLALSGLIGMAGKVGQAIGTWAADLVFKPTVWAGFAVLALAVVLYVIARFAGGKRPSRKERRAAEESAGAPQGVSGGAPALGGGAASGGKGAAPAGQSSGAKGAKKDDAEDFSDIEAILKKHGI